MSDTRSRAAFDELLDVLRQASEHYVGAARGGTESQDVADGIRNLTHLLQSGLYSHQEFDPERPVFNRIVSPTRSFTGDNPDALYFEAPVAAGGEYLVRGNVAGAVYTSFTMEAGAVDGKYATATAGVLRDDDIDIADDGSYEIRLGGEPADRNWLAVPAGGGRVTTRHYFEWVEPAAASQALHIPLEIHPLVAPGPRPRWSDDSVADAVCRVTNHVRDKTLAPPAVSLDSINFVSRTPNQFVPPVKPGNMAFSAFDAAYSMAPYALGPDDALVITGTWPACRFANVCLWTRFSQMYDYVTRTVSRNRATTTLEPDGSFRMVVAHRDPGVANWLDTEGRPTGSIFWRYFMPEGSIETPQAEVVRFAELT